MFFPFPPPTTLIYIPRCSNWYVHVCVCVVLLEEDPGGWTACGFVLVEAPLGLQPRAAVS